MSEPLDMSKLQDELDALNASITKQGSAVRQLKKDGADPTAIETAVGELKQLKSQSSSLTEAVEKNITKFNRKTFDELILRKMFVVPSFEIHGGVKGLFDLGPPACALKVSDILHVYTYLYISELGCVIIIIIYR
jgi:glycyl-tRNA synthetase